MSDQQAVLQTLFKKSAIALQGGDYKTARKGFEKLSRKVKDNALIWYNLGLSYQYLDSHVDAIQSYRKSIKLNPKLEDAVVNLAISYKILGQPDQAKKTVSVLVKSKNPRAIGLMGTMLAEQGELIEARGFLDQAYMLDTRDAESTFNLANVEFSLENYDRATRLNTPLVNDHPAEKKYTELQVRILLAMKDHDGAMKLLEEMRLRFGEDDDVRRLELALKQVTKSYFDIISICEKLLESHPKEADLWNALGNAYFQMDGTDQAEACYAKAIELDPSHSDYANNLGFAYSSLGDKENAEKYYRRAIELNPNNAEAYRNLVAMTRYDSMENEDVQKMIELWEASEAASAHRMSLAFALGKVYDDCGQYEKSFDTYGIGNALKFAESEVDLEKYLSHIDRIPTVLDHPPHHVAKGNCEHNPIFVLGMPRSGTTLVEQILARHSNVKGCGELPCIEQAILRIEKNKISPRVYPDDFSGLDGMTIEREAEAYQAWVARLHDVQTPWYVDKMPFNFVHIWLIKAMFPRSPVINCKRHPLDVIISNYFQMYNSDISFVYDLESLTQYYIRYHRLMEDWNRIFSGGIYNVSYEALVSDHEAEAQKLVEATGLDWEEACLDSKKRNTSVRTASIWQVRQGIYTRSKERWRNYEAQLTPVAKTLVAEGVLDESWQLV